MKLKRIILFILFFLIPPFASAVTITDTTFFSSGTNSTIFVDRIVLDSTTTTNISTRFYNVTSSGTNLTNTNSTFDARADFFGLDIGLTLHNINTSTNLFTSSLGSKDFNTTFTSGQTIRIVTIVGEVCSFFTKSILYLIIGFFALTLLAISLVLIFTNWEELSNLNFKPLLVVFIALIIGTIFIQVIADNILTVCP